MSKAQILLELPRLKPDELQEVMDRIVALEDAQLLNGDEAMPEEKAMRDRELEEYQQDPRAASSWEEAQARVRQSPKR